MLFTMVERGMEGEITSHKGKTKMSISGDNRKAGEEAMWAIIMAKELWKKGFWYVDLVRFLSPADLDLGRMQRPSLSSLKVAFILFSKFKVPRFTSS
jgi:hypothetical protein